MHRPTLVVAIVLLQTRAFQRPPRHVQSLAPVRAAAADDVNALMTQLNAAVQQEDFRKAAELKKQLDALRGDGGATTTKIQGGDWASRGAPGWLQARLLVTSVGPGCNHVVLDSRKIVGVALVGKHTAVHKAWMRVMLAASMGAGSKRGCWKQA